MSPVDPRERISEGVTRQRLGMEAKRSSRSVFGLIAGVAITLAIAFYFVTNISPTIGKSTREVRFEVASVFGVFEGFDEVRFRGVPAGTITAIERDGTQPVVVVEIQEQYGPIYRDAEAELRPVTPLNDLYLDIIDPGTPEAGEAEPDEALDESQTATSVFLPEVLNTLGSAEQRNVGRLLDQLGNGTEDGGEKLRRAFAELVPFLEAAGDLTRQIAVREDATKRLVHNTAVLTEELALRETQVRRLVASGSATFSTLQDGSADLDATLGELAPTVTELRTTLGSVNAVVDDVDTGLESLYPVAERLSPSLATIRDLNSSLGPAVGELREPVSALVPLVRALQPASRRLGTTFDALQPQLPVVDKVITNLENCEDGVIGFFQWNTSFTKFGDDAAPAPRGNLAFGVPDTGLPGLPKRQPNLGCTPGPIGNAVIRPKDTH